MNTMVATLDKVFIFLTFSVSMRARVDENIIGAPKMQNNVKQNKQIINFLFHYYIFPSHKVIILSALLL